jgi:hypothetical protein
VNDDHLRTLRELEELKYRYLRFLDLKRWDDLGAQLTDDCVATYAGGHHHYEGREAILEFLRENLPATRITTHHCHHPELALVGDDEATGTWALQDVVIDTELHFTIRGAAFYRDRYVRTADGWRIAATGYDRIYEEYEPRRDDIRLR